MAALHFPIPSTKFLSSSSHCQINVSPSSSCLLHLNHMHHHQLQPHQFCSISCSAVARKSRSSRKLMSDEHLCKNLLDFVSSIGMPAGYVPSMKELTEHGRKDLANIVRRRGYKFIKELLANSVGVANEPNLEESLTKRKIGIAADVDTADEKVKDMPHEVLDVSFLKEASIPANDTVSILEPTVSLDYQACMPIESSTVSSSLKSKDISDESIDSSSIKEASAPDKEYVPVLEPAVSLEEQGGISIEPTVSSSLQVKDISYEALGASSLKEASSPDKQIVPVLESAVSLEREGGISIKPTVSLSVQVKDISDEVLSASSTREAYNSENDSVTILEPYVDGDDQQRTAIYSSAVSSSLQENVLSNEDVDGSSFTAEEDSAKRLELGTTADDKGLVPVEHSTVSSLQEKVAAFMKYGKLDEIEDNPLYKVDDVAEGRIYVVHGEGRLPHVTDDINDNTILSRSVRMSSLTALPVLENGFMRSNSSFAVGAKEAKHDGDLHTERYKKERQVEVEHLKVMLHQKELELSQLKGQIEKEKEALFFLQGKAESEINKAQKLISEKDAELYAAEESLSGLKEVEIQFLVEGEMVELAGSFNGWHQRVMLDPQPSSDITDPVCSRKTRLWSTSLWLYPGVYEIKFIVDGQWTLDSQREITSGGGVQNNVLRIDR